MQEAGAGYRGLKAVILVSLAVMMLCAAALAQGDSPRVEIYTGYQWMDPGAKFNGVNVGSMPKGFNVASTFLFNKYAGVTLDSGASFGKRANIATISFGPTLKLPTENVTPFFHAMVGLNRVIPAGGFQLHDNNGVGIILGGGMDINVNRWLSIRAIQADYVWAHHNLPTSPPGNSKDFMGARLGGGLVFKLGSLGPPPPPPTASCSIQPSDVMAGEPVTVTATGTGFNPKATLSYSWTATGGKPAGAASSTQVDTTGLAPGSYTVTANVSGGKYAGKPAAATCSASFTVKEPVKNPPTISCSANPSSVKSGEPSTITSQAASPDNRPVTIGYTSSGGRISPASGASTTLDTAGAPAGPITISCTATDDRGLSANSSTSVNVEAGVTMTAPPTASKLNEITFKNPKKPARVDNEAKAILDDVALRLQRDSDAKAVVVGHATAAETAKKANKNLAAQRAANTAFYLTDEKGIDPSRIELRTSSAEGNTAEVYEVPAGATFDQPDTTVVPAGTVKGQSRNAAAPRHKKAAAAAPAK